MKLVTFMAKACHYAQEHIDDGAAWPTDEFSREQMLTCTSFQMACFLAQNTVLGSEGVDCNVIIDELTAHPGKSEKKWATIISRMAKELGGWKQSKN